MPGEGQPKIILGGNLTEKYLPVPVWNSATNRWEPIDFRSGQRVVDWPSGFDPRMLPVPDYHDGDRIQFVRDENCAREGVIRGVLLRGGIYSSLEEQNAMIKRWYLDPNNITYIVTARGHDHRVKAENILGRFISLERVSSVLPLQDL